MPASTAPLALAPVLDTVQRHDRDAIERLKAFLRIPSVSTDPAFDKATREAAEWAAGQLREIGFRTQVVTTKGHPMVLAHHDGAGAGSPRILY